MVTPAPILWVFFTFTLLSTRRHPSHPVTALTLCSIEVQALWSEMYDVVSHVVPG